MIVVVGSRHDPVACSLVAAWPGSGLCSAEDLTCPGWVWPLASPEPACWVVDGRPVPDREVSGVLLRRSRVYPEELRSTHPQDREYLAAEASSFLIFVLSRTRALSANPVCDGALGDDTLRAEHWMPIAIRLGIRLAPIELRHGHAPEPAATLRFVEVVGRDTFGTATDQQRRAAAQLAQALELAYAAVAFDARGRLVTLSTLATPGTEARAALGRLLEAGRKA